MAVEPVPSAPAATVEVPAGRALVVADVHAGIEAGLRREGVELASQADHRRETLLSLVAETNPDQLVVLGDLGHAIGTPQRDEREELDRLVSAITDRVSLTLVKGNHDGEIESLLADREDVTITDGSGVRLGSVGFAHGHTWPAPDVLAAETVCIGHEHPVVRLEDEVGGRRKERVWLRGAIDPAPFEDHYGDGDQTDDARGQIDGELVVFPAFNDLSGGTWINVEGQSFLAPFLPDGLADGTAYLLDGTRLGPYGRI
ncbi:Phosphoesterase protein [Halorhabdus tiamatea SARL4B]|uniref:Phosphoesterase n=1 Tax=Halorhabdus tiamatea SARL4B TaxID=1033806 RepID=F7PL88_9EURY|nr:metallophosphoesterase [Halorhabdus tiamatea]ERJ06979.1 Phosphoesterase protein [Halorhabdus tiamatea SARL4B]CCQ34751.1 phosphoesterase [Halorhabdus tiamatea SARL4B]